MDCTLLGIDPGANCGISLTTIKDNKIVSIKTALITDSMAASYVTGMPNSKVPTAIKSNVQCKLILNYVFSEMPMRIGMETAYFTSSFPSAYLSLTLRRYKLEKSISRYTSYRIDCYAPLELKKAASAKSNKKEAMLSGLHTLGLNEFIDLNNITEHEVDAIAVTLVMLKEIKFCHTPTKNS